MLYSGTILHCNTPTLYSNTILTISSGNAEIALQIVRITFKANFKISIRTGGTRIIVATMDLVAWSGFAIVAVGRDAMIGGGQ